MDDIFEKYKKLNIDGRWIGLEAGGNDPCFCTPIGAETFGWDNGIHFCFIDGFGETVFAVDPEYYGGHLVFPLARNFGDFLRLILAAKNTCQIEQIIWWDKKTYEEQLNEPSNVEYANCPETRKSLDAIAGLGITPMENPFEYVKEIQKDFPYDKIQYTNEYYDTLGLERPDGTERDDVYYGEARISRIFYEDK